MGKIEIVETELENIEKVKEDDSTNQNQSELDVAREIEVLSKYKVNYFNDEARKSNITMKEQEMKETQSKYEKQTKGDPLNYFSLRVFQVFRWQLNGQTIWNCRIKLSQGAKPAGRVMI